MKSLKIARIAAAALVAAASSAAFAAAGDSQNLTITATVSCVCRMSAIPDMTFTLDPSVGTDQTSTTTVQYKCSKGVTPATFTVGGVASAYSGNLMNGTLALPVGITWTAPTAAGDGLGSGVTPISVTLTGKILGTDYQNATAGTYTKTISVTVAP